MIWIAIESWRLIKHIPNRIKNEVVMTYQIDYIQKPKTTDMALKFNY